MNSKIPFPSIGCFHGRLSLLFLLTWGYTLSSAGAAYQDITIADPCPAHIKDGDPNFKTFGGAEGASLDSLSAADKTIAVNTPATVTNVLWGITAGSCDSGFPNVTCGSITIKFPDGTSSPLCDPASPNCAAPKASTATIGGTLSTTTNFDISVVAANDQAKPNCAATYHFHTGGAGGWGDPHLITVDGVHYDFQSAGEFTALRSNAQGTGQGTTGKGTDGRPSVLALAARGEEELEIQTRQTPVATTVLPGANDYTGLRTCVSLYTAVAARVGKYRVTYQPNISGVPDPSGMQLRVDGVLTNLGPTGINLGSDGRIVQSWTGNGAIEIDYSDGTQLVVVPAYWADQKKWYLNVNVYGAKATEGTFGKLPRDSWLPALPDGSSLGPKPTSLHQRYLDLYGKFADDWRVTDATSLFDYAPGQSTATFNAPPDWPRESPQSCAIPGQVSAYPVAVGIAEKACAAIVDNNMKADCVFDVSVTGHLGFAHTYLLTQQLQPGATNTIVRANEDPTRYGEGVTFTASVAANVPGGGSPPVGVAQFILDGAKVGEPVALDAKGRAQWSTSELAVGRHLIAANYSPTSGWGAFLASSSLKQRHTVIEGRRHYPPYDHHRCYHRGKVPTHKRPPPYYHRHHYY